MADAKSQFDEFVKAVEELELEDKSVQATSHTSAVSLTDWNRVQQAAAASQDQ
jgi:hypothetical protein